MTLDDIPANEKQEMTAEWAKLFIAAGCKPACHCCWRTIRVGHEFVLASVDGTDEMLCNDCTPDHLREKRAEREKQQKAEDAAILKARQREWEYDVFGRVSGGYSRPTRQRRKDGT